MYVLYVIKHNLLGIVSPLCIYGTIPIAASFSKKGMRDDWLAAFMMSSILLNPQLLIYSAVLGRTAFVIRLLSCIICGIIAGLSIRFFYRDKKFFDFTGFDKISNRDTDPNILLRFLKNIVRNIKATGGYFLIGIILSVLFQRYVPADAFSNIFRNQWLLCTDGCHDWSPAICMWWRHNSFTGGVVNVILVMLHKNTTYHIDNIRQSLN